MSYIQRLQAEQARLLIAAPDFPEAIGRAAEAQRRYERFADDTVSLLRAGLTRIVDALSAAPWEDMLRLFLEYQLLMPSNISGGLAVEAFMGEEPNTGIALAWVVPTELVRGLLALRDQPSAQLDFAHAHQEEILDQCDLVLTGLRFPAAVRCRESLACLRDGHPSASQSHAANIVDSVVCEAFAASHPRKQRKTAREIGGAPLPLGDEVTVRALVERAVLGPVVGAFAQWFPDDGVPLPDGFARHATAHAAHLDGVFKPEFALAAVMLATSLVVHYRSQLGPMGSFDPYLIPGQSPFAGVSPE